MGTPPERTDPEAHPDESGSPTGEVSVQRIQAINLVILAAATLGALWVSKRFALGVLAGGALMAANFRVIASVVPRVLVKGSPSAAHAGIYWLKFTGMLTLVGVAVVFLRIDPVGLLVGLSTIFVAVTAEATLRLAGK